MEGVDAKKLGKRSRKAGSGSTSLDEWGKTASVYVLNQEDYEEDDVTGDVGSPYDAEAILVHELLHVRMPLSTDDLDPKEEYLFESGLEQVAQVLVGMKRGKDVG